MYAGIDSGTTLKKGAWRKPDGSFQLIRGLSDEFFYKAMRDARVSAFAEIGMRPFVSPPEDIRHIPVLDSDRITAELSCQALGARSLLASTHPHLESFLLVSIGTGVSYTAIRKGVVDRYPIGSACGGGLISGIASLCGVKLGSIPPSISSSDSTADLLIKDLDTTKEDTLEGEIVLAHFGKVSRTTSPSQIVASAINVVAAGVVKDIMVMHGFLVGLQNIVYIGTPVAKMPALRERLIHFHKFLPIAPIMLSRGEFSGAIGALLSAEREGKTS